MAKQKPDDMIIAA